MGLTQSTAPSTEPVTQAEAKSHLRIDTADENDLIDSLIAAARRLAETFTGRQFVTATWELTLDEFPGLHGKIYLPRPPLATVTSVVYIDTDGTSTTKTSSEYKVIIDGVIGYVVPAYLESWPTSRRESNAVTVTYTAGYGAASAVPDTIKSAIYLIIGDLFENRERQTDLKLTLNSTAQDLLWSERVLQVA